MAESRYSSTGAAYALSETERYNSGYSPLLPAILMDNLRDIRKTWSHEIGIHSRAA